MFVGFCLLITASPSNLLCGLLILLSYSSLPVSPRKESAGQGSVLLSGVPAPENPWCHVSGVFTGGASHLSFRACGFLPGGEGLVLNPSAAWARANRRQTCLPASHTRLREQDPGRLEGAGPLGAAGHEAGEGHTRLRVRRVFTASSVNCLKQTLNPKLISPAPSPTVIFFSCGAVLFSQERT